ncbi:MAG: zinc ribbon domain-containing protein [Leptospiraceae bacterium]|nr:zinc ribbon domain-containing protein [Leptospiraceae bacterium]
MPTYDYKCKTCDKVFEHFQAMKDEPLKECLCEKKGEVSRMISGGTGIIFKGSGFYVTDYKKSGSGESSASVTTPSTTPATPTTTTPAATTSPAPSTDK